MDELPDNVEFDEDAAAVLLELEKSDPDIYAAIIAACSYDNMQLPHARKIRATYLQCQTDGLIKRR